MKKKILNLALIAMMAFSLIGCAGRKASVKILIEGFTNFESFEFPKGTNGHIDDDYLVVELNKYGEFDIVIHTDDGKSYDFHISHSKDSTAVTSEAVKDLVVEFE